MLHALHKPLKAKFIINIGSGSLEKSTLSFFPDRRLSFLPSNVLSFLPRNTINFNSDNETQQLRLLNAQPESAVFINITFATVMLSKW